jgi:hypothetical protein
MWHLYTWQTVQTEISDTMQHNVFCAVDRTSEVAVKASYKLPSSYESPYMYLTLNLLYKGQFIQDCLTNTEIKCPYYSEEWRNIHLTINMENECGMNGLTDSLRDKSEHQVQGLKCISWQFQCTVIVLVKLCELQ